jgi:hypothetical protein
MSGGLESCYNKLFESCQEELHAVYAKQVRKCQTVRFMSVLINLVFKNVWYYVKSQIISRSNVSKNQLVKF